MRYLLLGLCLLGMAGGALAADIEGRWVTIDDETGEEKSIVALAVNKDGELEGRIVHIMNADARDDVCEKCPDELEGQPIQGLRFLWGFTPESDTHWRDGHILDPKKGKVYRAKATLAEDGQTLTVRGFVGFSLFGRSQTWQRLPEEAPDKD